jgi:hypothetical protein
MYKWFISRCAVLVIFLQSGQALASIPCTAEDKLKLPRQIQATTAVNGQSIKIKVTVPGEEHISRCAVAALEYGDLISYSFAPGYEAVVDLTVENPMSLFQPTKRSFKLKFLSLDPTLLADERERFPHHVRIKDTQAKMVHDIYLNRDGRPAMTRSYFMNN